MGKRVLSSIRQWQKDMLPLGNDLRALEKWANEFDNRIGTIESATGIRTPTVSGSTIDTEFVAGTGMSGGGFLSYGLLTFNVGAGTGITVAADTVLVDQTFTPTWTGVHTFSAQDVHNAGISLGTSGAIVSAVANAASNIGILIQYANNLTNRNWFEIDRYTGSAHVPAFALVAGGKSSASTTLRHYYDSTNYWSALVSSTGTATFSVVGTSPAFNFSTASTFSSTLTANNTFTAASTSTFTGEATFNGNINLGTTPSVIISAKSDAGGVESIILRSSVALTETGWSAAGDKRTLLALKNNTSSLRHSFYANGYYTPSGGIYVGVDPLDATTAVNLNYFYKDDTDTTNSRISLSLVHQSVRTAASSNTQHGALFDKRLYDSGGSSGLTHSGVHSGGYFMLETTGTLARTYSGKCQAGLFDFGYVQSGDYEAVVFSDLYGARLRYTDADSGAGTDKTVTTGGFLSFEYGTDNSKTTYTNWRGINIPDCSRGATVGRAIEIAAASTSTGAAKQNVYFAGGNWNTGHLQLGASHIWFDGTDIRGNVGTPTSASDGVLIGTAHQSFNKTDSTTVNNTTTETSLVGTGTGTVTLPANFLIIGRTVRIHAAGYYSDAAAPGTIDFRVRLGGVSGTVILDTTALTPSGSVSNQLWEMDAYFTCRTTGATGTIFAQGHVTLHDTTAASRVYEMVNTATVTIDTTAAQAVTPTLQWGAADAANTLTCTNLTVEPV